MSVETVELETPVGRDWGAVVRLVLGGIGDRLGLGLDDLDDLQLAVERLLAEALQGPEPPPGALTLQRVLSTVVDSYGVERLDDAGVHVRVEKAITRTA